MPLKPKPQISPKDFPNGVDNDKMKIQGEQKILPR